MAPVYNFEVRLAPSRAVLADTLNETGYRRRVGGTRIDPYFLEEWTHLSVNDEAKLIGGNTRQGTRPPINSFEELQTLLSLGANAAVTHVKPEQKAAPSQKESTLSQLFDLDKITAYVGDILLDAGLPNKHARAFVEMSLERKQRFHHMQFDSFGRRHIPFTVTPKVLLNDYTWFRKMLEEMEITQEALTVMLGKVYVLTARGGGAPLTKELAKNADQLFARGKTWFNGYEYGADIIGKPEAFLARLGDVINLGKKAVISINPGDILRKSMSGKYSAYTSCHNLLSGQYRQGPICYCLDKSHMVTYITDGGDQNEKMHGRSMLVVSNDMNVVAMRRFYPSPEVFGSSRAQAIREEVHKLIAPGTVWKKSSSTNIIQPSTQLNGYMDDIAVATYLDPALKFKDTELTKEIFCFGCGKIHTRTTMFCGNCGASQASSSLRRRA